MRLFTLLLVAVAAFAAPRTGVAEYHLRLVFAYASAGQPARLRQSDDTGSGMKLPAAAIRFFLLSWKPGNFHWSQLRMAFVKHFFTLSILLGHLVENLFSKMARTMLREIRVSTKQELIDRIHLYFQEVNAAARDLPVEVQNGRG
jgi:hypothetical protein